MAKKQHAHRTSTKRKTGELTARAVEQCRKKFEAGEERVVLDAIDLCARAGLPMPIWLVDAFCERYEKWRLFQAKSLDDAFGARRRKGVHIKRAAERAKLQPRVMLSVLRLRRKKRPDGKPVPIDEALFERVGKELKIGKSLANEIYYDDKNPWRKLLEQIVTPATKI
jgi:hypothetical protein